MIPLEPIPIRRAVYINDKGEAFYAPSETVLKLEKMVKQAPLFQPPPFKPGRSQAPTLKKTVQFASKEPSVIEGGRGQSQPSQEGHANDK